MIVGIVLVLALVAAIAFFAWQYQAEQAAMLAAQIRIEEIHAQARLDYLDHVWPFFVLLSLVAIILVAIAAYTIIVVRRPRPIVNDNRTIILLQQGQSRRRIYKSLGQHYEALPLAPGKSNREVVIYDKRV